LTNLTKRSKILPNRKSDMRKKPPPRQHKEEYVAMAERHGWIVVVEGNLVTCMREEQGDGFPHRLTATFEGKTMKDGLIWNNYGLGDGQECFKAGLQLHRLVLQGRDAPLKYKPFYQAFLTGNPVSRSEKVIASTVGVSERQIRKARISGIVEDEYLLDRLCFKLLGSHPASIYGYDNWMAGVDLMAEVE